MEITRAARNRLGRYSPGTGVAGHWPPTPFYWREAGLCFPAIPLILVVGVATNNVGTAAIAVGAAYSVGFGAARDLRGQRWGAMFAATIGMSIAAFVGSLSGQYFPRFALLCCISAAMTAALSLAHEDLWWVALQVLVSLFVAGSFPGPMTSALHRGLVVLIGGTVQMLLVVILARLFPNAGAPLPASPPSPQPTRRSLVSHVTRAAACVMIAMIIAHLAGLANSYWAPMTGMLVLKPGLHETRARGWNRLTGTVIGCVVASLYAIGTGYSEPLLIAGVSMTACLSFALQKANYAILTTAITATVVLLLSLGRGPVLLSAEHRLIATVLGGLVALLVAWIAPHRATPDKLHQKPDVVGALNQ